MELTPEPIGDHIIVVPDELPTKTEGGLELPKGYKPTEHWTGTVAAVGPGRLDAGVRVRPNLHRGDRVAYAEYAGMEFTFGEAKFRVMTEDDIMFRLVEKTKNGVLADVAQ